MQKQHSFLENQVLPGSILSTRNDLSLVLFSNDPSINFEKIAPRLSILRPAGSVDFCMLVELVVIGDIGLGTFCVKMSIWVFPKIWETPPNQPF